MGTANVWTTLPPALAVALVVGILGAGASSRAEPSDSRTLVVTSDTSAYCRTLSEMIAARRPLPREVRELKSQGDGMCQQGEIRGGITRLRRALLVLRSERTARP